MRLPCGLNGHCIREPSKPGRKDFPEGDVCSDVQGFRLAPVALSTLLDTRQLKKE